MPPHNDVASRRWRTELQALLALGLPIILGNLSHMLIFATDTAFIGHYAPYSLASAALANNLLHMMMAVGFGLSMASAPMMANAIGRGVHALHDIRRTVRQAIWVCWAYSALAVAALWHGEALLLWLGQDPVLAHEAGSYLRILQWMIFPLLGFWVLRFFALTLGRPQITLIVTLMGIGVNALGNYALVFGHFGFPEMGLTGSGISSVASSLFMFIAMGVFCLTDRRLSRYAVLGRWWRADWPRFKELWRLGFPIGITSAMEGLLFSGSVFIVGQFGPDGLAAHAIVMQLCSIAFMIPLGFSEAATIRVGLWAGQNDRAGTDIAGRTAITVSIGFAIITALVMFTMPQWLIHPFLEPGVPGTSEVTKLAGQYLVLAALFQIADSAQMVGAVALRGLKDTRQHMVFILIGHMILAFPIGGALAFFGGLEGLGVWIGFAIGLTCVAAMVLYRWHSRHRLNLLQRCLAMA